MLTVRQKLSHGDGGTSVEQRVSKRTVLERAFWSTSMYGPRLGSSNMCLVATLGILRNTISDAHLLAVAALHGRRPEDGGCRPVSAWRCAALVPC